MTRRTLQILGFGLGIAAAMLAGGCAGSGGGGASLDAGSPGVRGSRSGLELRRWVIRGQRGQSDRLLGVLAEASEFDVPAEARRWEQGGVRAAKVDAADIDVLRSYLSNGNEASGGLGSLVQERIEWVGLLPEWVPIHRGVTRPQTTAMIDSGPLRVDPGAVSLLGRSWVMPSLDGGSLRVELVPQVPVRGAEGTVFIDGAPLMRQQLGITLDSGEALIVFPGGAWGSTQAAAPTRAEFRSEQPDLDQVGPPAPTTPTLGELMLVVDGPTASAPGEPVLEQVLVFVAHLPQTMQVEIVNPGQVPLAEPKSADEPAQSADEPAAESQVEAAPSVESDEPAASASEPAADPAGEPATEPESDAP